MHPVEIKFREALKIFPDLSKRKFLLAVSGGVDSMVLAELFRRENLLFGIAHCNFGLRGRDSNADEALVREYARVHSIPFHYKFCPVKEGNIQLKARELRYAFFEKTMQEEGYQTLVTAHHADDELETFFINLMRGTGIKGLSGIPSGEKIFRPLKKIFKDELVDYARANRLTWREDVSNFSGKYLRNRIRKHLIPLLDNIRPGSKESILKSIALLKLSADFQQKKLDELLQKYIIKTPDKETLILKPELEDFEIKLLIFHWLSKKGFTDFDALFKLTEAQTGREVLAPGFRLIKQADKFILYQQKIEPENGKEYKIEKTTTSLSKPVRIKLEKVPAGKVDFKNLSKAGKNTIYLDFHKLSFPLYLRKMRKGDRFYPFGMQGSKKLSDFFKDEHIPRPERESVWLLTDTQDSIVWVVGFRPDDRFKVDENTREILKIDYFPG